MIAHFTPGCLELIHQILIAAFETAYGLARTLRAPAHGTERIRVTRHTASQPYHYQNKSQLIQQIGIG